MNWQPFVSSIFVSIFIGLPGMIILYNGTKVSRKAHLMNVFSQIFYSLLFMGAFVRCFYWMVWAWPGTPITDDGGPVELGLPIGIRAFLITYPQLNTLICAYLIQYPWLYDFIMI